MISIDTQKVAAQFRMSDWGEAVKERIVRGQSISEFCEERGISKNTYYYRQKKVRKAACPAMIQTQKPEKAIVPNGWTQLTEVVSAPAFDNYLTVEVCGCQIKVNTGTDPVLLAKVCGVLKSL